MQNPIIEQLAISKLLQSKNPELLVRITSNQLHNQDLLKLFFLIRQAYLQDGTWLTFDHLQAKAVSLCKTADKAQFMHQFIEQLKSKDTSSLAEDELIKELEDYRKFRLITEKASKLVDSVQLKDIDASLAHVQSMYEDVFVKNSSSTLDDHDSVNLMGKKVKYLFRKVGIPALDERGPLVDGGLTLIAGGSGKGKSIGLIQFSLYQLFNYPESVAYFTYELSAAEIYARVLSNIAEVDVGNIMSDCLNPEEVLKKRQAELKLHFEITDEDAFKFTLNCELENDEGFYELAKNTLNRRKNKLYIFDETCGIDSLLIKMQMLRDVNNVNFFGIDYLTLIPRGRGLTAGLQDWQVFVKYSEMLKMFAKEEGKKTRVATPLQFKEKEDELKFSKDIENACDLYISFKQDEDDKELNTVTLDFKKFRTFLTVKGKPLGPVKLGRKFEYSKFTSFDF